jgi:hypothetical protein
MLRSIAAVLGGALWLVLVVWVVLFGIEAARDAAADGAIADPSDARVVTVWVSGAVFSLPGLGFIAYGIRRHRS